MSPYTNRSLHWHDISTKGFIKIRLNQKEIMTYQLTKSGYIKGLQCDKALYLFSHKRHLGVISKETQEKFNKGLEFESKFKAQFADGIALDKQFGFKLEKNISFTNECLKQSEKKTLFEAGFVHDEVLVLTDVLCKEADGTTIIYEVKDSTELTDVIKADLSVQYYVCKSQLSNIRSFNVVLNDGNDGFTIIDMKKELETNTVVVKENIVHFKDIQLQSEPEIEIGNQCTNPYECEFSDYCGGGKKRVINKPTIEIEGIELDIENRDFQNAFELVQNTNTPIIYLTGKAGTGKTTFLKYLRATTNKNLVVLAPTGVAAVNAGGQTINSFFQIGPKSIYVPNDKRLRQIASPDDPDTIYDHFKYFTEKKKIIQNMELLIIDEISMVRCDLLDVIDTILRAFRKNKKAFGGVQVILIGDTFQLPPIAKPDEWKNLAPYYSSPFFFNSKVIESNRFIYIELKKIYRQNEQDFIDLLNRIRENKVSTDDYIKLNAKYNPTFLPSNEDNYIFLSTTNPTAESYNVAKLSELKTELRKFEATITGKFSEVSMPTDKVLQLKEGSQVMFRKNNIPTYFNGTMGKIVSIKDDKIIVEIDKNDGKRRINVEKAKWENIKYSWDEKNKRILEEVVGTFTQYPIKLAWAITVHKSQGLTFDKVIADVGDAFSSGQVYVALSRCTSFNGLVLRTTIGPRAIKTDPRVLEFAKKETPETLVNNELKTGKADFYYEKSRTAIKEARFEEGFNNLLEAIKYRNDTSLPIFKRFFVTTAERLHSFVSKYDKLLKDYTNLQKRTVEKDTIIENFEIYLQNQIYGLNHSLDRYIVELEESKTREEELNDRINSMEQTINEKERSNFFLTSINKKQNERISQYTNTINELSKQLDKYKAENSRLSNEITRLSALKWYHKLLGKK